MSPLVRADCKIVEVSLHAREGDPAYTARAVFEVLETVTETTDVVLAGTRMTNGPLGERWASVYRSVNGGRTWTKQADWTANQKLTMDLFEAENGDVFASTGSAIVGQPGEIWRSQDRGERWERVYQDAAELYVGGLGQAENGDLVAGTMNSGHFLRSQDGGDTWAQVDATVALRAIRRIIRASNGDLIAGVGRGGVQAEIYRSQDNGASWGLVQTLVPSTGGYVYDFVRLANGDLLAGLTYQSAQVWRSQDDGATWAKLSTLPGGQTYVYSMALSPDGTVFAGSYPDCRVFVSGDGGATWEGTDLSDDGTAVSALAVLSNGEILAGTDDAVDDETLIWRSQYSGGAWAQFSSLAAPNVWMTYRMIVLSEES